MVSPVIDLPTLLAPLGGDGGGVDLRVGDAPLYWALRDARTAAREQERAADRGDPEADPAAALAAWREVKRLGITCLSGWSKDFAIAAWLIEALVRLDGLPGLTAGAALISGLLERYWESGFPRPELDVHPEEKYDSRLLPLAALAGYRGASAWEGGTVVQPLRLLPLFHRPDGSPVHSLHWHDAVWNPRITDAGRQAIRAELQTQAGAHAAQMEDLIGQLRAARAAWLAVADQRVPLWATGSMQQAVFGIADMLGYLIGTSRTILGRPSP